jgi:3-oxoacyl-[acyl-carrier protein] reductase
LGQAVTTRLLSEGAAVCVWDIAVTQEHEDKDVLRIAVDVANPDSVVAAFERTLRWRNTIDILVSSAGITGPTRLCWEYSSEDWNKVLQVNLTGVFNCGRAVVPTMKANGYGRIVNVASIAGKEGNPKACAYSASKAGVIALTKSLGKELALDGVVANCVAPAAIKTALFEQMEDSFVQYMLSKIPMNRFGTLDEAASLICWLASEEPSFCTGAVFDLSGGRAVY